MRDHQAKKIIRWGIVCTSLIWQLQTVASAQTDAEIVNAARACQRVTVLSARLACYDQILPPALESAEAAQTDNVPAQPADAVPLVNTPEPVAANPAEPVAAMPAEPAAVIAEPVAPPVAESRSARAEPVRETDLPNMVQIVDVVTPNPTTTTFHAADGRVFLRERASRIYRWPETPFDVEIQTSRFGAVFLKFEDGLRIRVAIR